MYKLLPQSKTEDTDDFTSQFIPAVGISLDFLEEAIFAGHRFWGLESAFGRADGVIKTATGYCGGTLRKPTYREVSEGHTGHTEAVKVIYDKQKISYKSLCNVFWESHDPTNKIYLRFGLDTHYRSAIFYATEEMKKQARESKIRWQMKLNRRIVTKIIPYDSDFFFLAENQHQKYYLQKDYINLCGSLSLRSTEQFINSHIACKLNGIFGGEKNMVAERLKRLMESCELPNQTKLVLEEILQDLENR